MNSSLGFYGSVATKFKVCFTADSPHLCSQTLIDRHFQMVYEDSVAASRFDITNNGCSLRLSVTLCNKIKSS